MDQLTEDGEFEAFVQRYLEQTFVPALEAKREEQGLTRLSTKRAIAERAKGMSRDEAAVKIQAAARRKAAKRKAEAAKKRAADARLAQKRLAGIR